MMKKTDGTPQANMSWSLKLKLSANINFIPVIAKVFNWVKVWLSQQL